MRAQYGSADCPKASAKIRRANCEMLGAGRRKISRRGSAFGRPFPYFKERDENTNVFLKNEAAESP